MAGRFFVAAGLLPLLLGYRALAGQLVQDTNFFSAILDYVAKSEYEIRWIEDQSVYKSANRAQNLRFTYYSDGFAVEPRDYGEGNPKPWEITMRLRSFGKSPASGLTVGSVRWAVKENAASVTADGIVIEYTNERAGLRQNFRILNRPPGREPLQLVFAVETAGLELQSNEPENFVYFVDQSGKEAVRYWDLHAWDATEQELEARMVKLGNTDLAIVVDDETASYPIFVDPLLSEWAHTESRVGVKFGYSVSYSGKIQDSGSEPVGLLIGAPNFDPGASPDAGKVFVYYGGNTLATTPTWSRDGDLAYGHFGWSVATAGDVEGNGWDDIIVGAPHYDSGSYTDNGKVYVFFGNTNGISSTNWSATGYQSYSHFGYAVAGMDNINSGQDSLKDIAVGAPYYDYLTTDDGAVYFYKGRTNDVPVTYTTIFGSAGSRFGFSIASAHNVNHDSYPDVIVGAPNAKSGGVPYGAAYVYYSTSTGLNGGVTSLWGTGNGGQFGFSVAGVGDADGDTCDDVLVGALYHTNGQTQEGKAYLFRGTSGGINTTPAWTVESDQAGALLGYSVAGGDITADAYPIADLIIGAPYYDTTSLGLTDNGEAWFYKGVSGGNPTFDDNVLGIKNGDHNGWSVAFAWRILYRTSGFVVGAPDAHNTSGDLTGGTVTAWKYTP